MTVPTPPERDALIAEVEARHQRLHERLERVEITGVSGNDLYVAAMMDSPKLVAQLRADAEEIAALRRLLAEAKNAMLDVLLTHSVGQSHLDTELDAWQVRLRRAIERLEAPDAR